MKKIRKYRGINKLLHFAVCGFFCFMCFSLTAQIRDICGPYKINYEALKKALEYEKNDAARIQSSHYLMRVYFHICKYDDGLNPGATKADIENEFNALIQDYITSNICFIYCGIDSINSTKLDTVNIDTDPYESLFKPYQIPNCINIFYTNEINGVNSANGGGIGGVAFRVPGNICLVSKGNIGLRHTVSHEVGHCLGLYHTFENANGIENIDGSNCKSAADLICDTEADPYAFNSADCFSKNGCQYDGNCTDNKGNSNYTPPYHNIMSYWKCFTDLLFTADQFVRIKSFLGSSSILLACESPDNITIGPFVVKSDGYYIETAISSLNNSGPVNISGTAFSILGGAKVQLSSGFHAYPSTGGLIFITSSNCNYPSLTTKSIARLQYDKTHNLNGNKFFLYPNPATNFIHISGSGEKNILVEIIDINGKAVLKQSLVNSGINISKLAAGNYVVRLTMKDHVELLKLVKL